MNRYNHNILTSNGLTNIFFYSKCNRLHKTNNHIKKNNDSINFHYKCHNYLYTKILRLIYFTRNAIVCIYKQSNNVKYLLDDIESYIHCGRNILENSRLKISVAFYMQSFAYCYMPFVSMKESLCEK